LSEYIQTSFIIIDLGLVTESQLGLEVPHKINEIFSNLLNNKIRNVNENTLYKWTNRK